MTWTDQSVGVSFVPTVLMGDYNIVGDDFWSNSSSTANEARTKYEIYPGPDHPANWDPMRNIDRGQLKMHPGARIIGGYVSPTWTNSDHTITVIDLEMNRPRPDRRRIVAKHSGKCLDVWYGSTANGARIMQFGCHGGDNQSFTLWPDSLSNMAISSTTGGKVMAVNGDSHAHGANVLQWEFTRHSPTQRWRAVLQTVVGGVPYYRIENSSSGKCLDVAWFSTADGADVLQANCTGTDNQLWDIQNLATGAHGY